MSERELDSSNNKGYAGSNGTGGTQSAGGKTYNLASCSNGTFGQGANLCNYEYGSSGAGGGFFGGGGSNSSTASNSSYVYL